MINNFSRVKLKKELNKYSSSELEEVAHDFIARDGMAELINNSTQKKEECVSYFKTGSAFAEKLLGANSSSERTVVNLTMYERKDGEYNLHYCSLPFRGYHHAVMFSSEQLVAMDSGSSSRLLVDDKHFSTLPFLSNSVQQFSMWLQSANRILGSKLKSKISFTFDSSHALTFCYELENSKSSFDQRFDLIYTGKVE